uniref:Uncharacterized protein n=1 Tax=Steinernema glaseri TaxID=37863 RepID=A0A1I8A1X8_9BILA
MWSSIDTWSIVDSGDVDPKNRKMNDRFPFVAMKSLRLSPRYRRAMTSPVFDQQMCEHLLRDHQHPFSQIAPSQQMCSHVPCFVSSSFIVTNRQFADNT